MRNYLSVVYREKKCLLDLNIPVILYTHLHWNLNKELVVTVLVWCLQRRFIGYTELVMINLYGVYRDDSLVTQNKLV